MTNSPHLHELFQGLVWAAGQNSSITGAEGDGWGCGHSERISLSITLFFSLVKCFKVVDFKGLKPDYDEEKT